MWGLVVVKTILYIIVYIPSLFYLNVLSMLKTQYSLIKKESLEWYSFLQKRKSEIRFKENEKVKKVLDNNKKHLERMAANVHLNTWCKKTRLSTSLEEVAKGTISLTDLVLAREGSGIM